MQTPPYSQEELRRCREVLEAITANRLLLGEMADDERKGLLMAAGRLSRPERLEIMKLAKAHRKLKKKKERLEDRATRKTTDIREIRKLSVFVAPTQKAITPPTTEARRLNTPRHCYVCKKDFQYLHFFYDTMCTPCGDLNYQKRFQTAPLEGRVALITGSRVKIGFQAALMLLRAGCKVIVTTRFPQDAAERYAKESDFKEWGHRLQIHGLDLRHAPSVELFCNFLVGTEERLDFLLNNAAQTVRRPVSYYKSLLNLPNLSPDAQKLLASHNAFTQRLLQGNRLPPGPGEANTSWIAEWNPSSASASVGIHSSVQMSQMPWTNEDMTAGKEVFPEGARDADLQQVDLRGHNSWRMTLGEVPTPEMIEVQLVNSVSPFILCSKLKPLMLRVPTRDKHIVNVSAMEGKFARHTKTDKHPHTNMAKAALNMLTLTSAPDYWKDGIHMNAVDTGWVTDEDPLHLSVRKQEEHDFQPPLDIVDGAARIVDPIFSGLLTGHHTWGKFLKDYFPTEW